MQPLPLPAGENAAAINMTTPARIVRMRLAPDGRSVTALETLQSHHQRAFLEPTTAALAADGLYVLARTHVTRFNEQGGIDGAETLAPPLILRIPLPTG